MSLLVKVRCLNESEFAPFLHELNPFLNSVSYMTSHGLVSTKLL